MKTFKEQVQLVKGLFKTLKLGIFLVWRATVKKNWPFNILIRNCEPSIERIQKFYLK